MLLRVMSYDGMKKCQKHRHRNSDIEIWQGCSMTTTEPSLCWRSLQVRKLTLKSSTWRRPHLLVFACTLPFPITFILALQGNIQHSSQLVLHLQWICQFFKWVLGFELFHMAGLGTPFIQGFHCSLQLRSILSCFQIDIALPILSVCAKFS